MVDSSDESPVQMNKRVDNAASYLQVITASSI